MSKPTEPVRMVAQVSVQQKIAEIERRLADLECRPCRCMTVRMRTVDFMESKPDWNEFNRHWRELWKNFDAAVKALFKGIK